MTETIPTNPERFLQTISEELSNSASLFSGQCHFSIPSSNSTRNLEDIRQKLIQETLKATSLIFNESIQTEEHTLEYISALVSHSRDQRPTTRSKSNQKPSSTVSKLTQTPLNSLYCGEEGAEGIVLNDESIWKQIKLKHDCVMGWVREALDEDEFEELDEDSIAANRKEALGLPPDEEDEEGLFDLDEMDLDDLEGLDEESTEDDEEEFDEEEEKSVPYVTSLNDQEDNSSDQSDSESDDSEPKEPKEITRSKGKSKSKESETTPSIETLESRTKSSKNSSRTPRSKVDDNFFSLQEFEEETDQGELQMRRQLRKWSGEGGEPEDEGSDEDEEDVDLFSGFDTGIIPGDDEGESDEDEEEDEDGNAMDLDMVANLRYGDFFDPPARLPTKKQKQKQKPTEDKSAKKTPKKKNSDIETIAKPSKSPRVMFSEQVIVKEIPANNKGVRVSDMSSGFDDEDDESEGSISLDESDDEEGSEEDEDKSDDSEDDQSGTETETESNASGDKDVRTMNRISTDLFSDGFSETSDPEDPSSSEPQSLSKHAKKLKMLSKQIAELEAENVAKKDWTLKGEATARDRPQNSLLEEDLEFEHIQKIAPAVTEEKTLGLEALIKQRILDGQFDDVIRRRPIDLKAFLPSRLLELQDTKSSRSLAETYEDEYRSEKHTNETGTKPMDAKDEKLEKAHLEIKEMYEDLCGKLDALSNAHFTPKAPKATIKTINNLPTIALESALPVSVGSGTLLAPEEVYSVDPKEIQQDRNELSHVQKQTQRRERKLERKNRLKKIEAVTGKRPVTKEEKEVGKMSVKEQKESSMKALSRVEGVTIIGKRAAGTEDGPKKSRKLQNGSSLKL